MFKQIQASRIPTWMVIALVVLAVLAAHSTHELRNEQLKSNEPA